MIETFDSVAGTYKRLRRLQDKDIQFQLKRLSISPAQERKYKKLKNEIIGEVKSLRLNRARIDTLVEQLYDINKRLVGYEGRLMRLAESHGVSREEFLKNYLGSELDPLWLNRVPKLTAKGWKNFVARDKDRIKELRAQIHMLATETGLEIGDFRKIVHMVQKGEREALQAKKERVCRPTGPLTPTIPQTPTEVGAVIMRAVKLCCGSRDQPATHMLPSPTTKALDQLNQSDRRPAGASKHKTKAAARALRRV